MDDICHIIVPHNVLSIYCPKRFLHNGFKAIGHFCPL